MHTSVGCSVSSHTISDIRGTMVSASISLGNKLHGGNEKRKMIL